MVMEGHPQHGWYALNALPGMLRLTGQPSVPLVGRAGVGADTEIPRTGLWRDGQRGLRAGHDSIG